MTHPSPVFKRLQKANGGIVLVGLGVLWMTGLGFWPWILVVFGIVALVDALAAGAAKKLEGVLWLGGLFVLFMTDTIWPGILILVGLSILYNQVVAPALQEQTAQPYPVKHKRKRTLPEDEFYDDEDEFYAYYDEDDDAYVIDTTSDRG